MLPSNFRKRVLIVASQDDFSCKKILQNYEKANATILQPDEFIYKEMENNQYDSICIFSSSSSFDENAVLFSLEIFHKCFKAIQLGGSFSLQLCLQKAENQNQKYIKELEKQCMYAGFVDPEVVFNSAKNGAFVLKVLCNKPEWESGAAAATIVEDEELVDESSLIDRNEKYQKMGIGKEGCSTKPRACANCTCGRKELEDKEDEEEKKKMLEGGAIRSSCGNCYLGDAFRCKGCPYAGLPAFRPGDKVQLDMQKNNVSHTNGNQNDTGNEIGVTTDGKIKLKV